MVIKSLVENEYIALASVTSKITWLNSLFLEVGLFYEDKPTIWCDNVSPIELARKV